MEDLEGKIGQILSDPQAMADIFSMVQSMGFAPPPAQESPDPVPNGLFQTMASGLGESSREQALFQAIRPFLRPERQEKLDKAIKLGQMSKVATAALKTMDL